MRNRYSRNNCRKGQYSGEKVNSRMHGWKKEQMSPADTYIEWRFECKCRQLSDGFRILTEWRKHKQQYISIMNTIIFDFQHYSRHDVTHSIKILESIEMLLGKRRVDMLSAGDLWLLLEGAYSHDIGMALTYDELLEMWEEDTKFQEFILECIENDFGDLKDAALYYKQIDNLLQNRDRMEDIIRGKEIDFEMNWPLLSHRYVMMLISEYIRKNHAERVTRITQELEKEIEPVIEERLYKVSIRVSQMHGRDFKDLLSELKPRGKGFANTSIHPQFIAAMIRIGDLLDIENNRFSPYAVKHFGRLPLTSMAHLKKHKSITHFDISEHQISVEAHVKEYEVAILAKDWFGWIDNEVENLICAWNDIVPEALYGCTLTKSNCKVFLLDERSGEYHLFNSNIQRNFSVNKKKLIKLLIGTSLYESKMEFLREYIQNALDAAKMQLWIDLKNGNHRLQMNPKSDIYGLTPLDLEDAVYNHYSIKLCVEWNKTKDKVLIKIVDRGIGIESEYLNHLLHIGTGWRGRICYEEELREMPKWLYPTGGFGIGIQSAFMVTDSVEILTKSNKDMQGYRIILESPEKGGSVSVEEVSGIYEHGTIITVEIEPERIQNWKEQVDKKKFFLSKLQCDFDEGQKDIFCPDALLEYTEKFLEEYVKTYIPNPLFPIEISIPYMEESIIHYNPYWSGNRYWKNEDEYSFQEIAYQEKLYLCIYNHNARNNRGKQFMVWSYSDEVFQVIRLNNQPDLENIKICFKNVVVKDADKSVLEDYCAYQTCIDFMGFRAENCLKVHRNFFDEDFDLKKYCRRGFLLYFLYLKEYLGDRLEEYDNEWNESEAQLLRISAFNSVFEKERSDIQRRTEVEKYTFTVNEQNEYTIERERKWEQIYLAKILAEILGNSDVDNAITEGESGRGIAVLPTKEMWNFLKDEKMGKCLISSKNVRQWKENGNVDERKGKLKVQILNAVAGEIGVITEERIVSMLLRHKCLKRMRVDFGVEEKLIYLSVPEKEEVYSEQQFYDFFTKADENECERRILQGKNAEKYEKLCVSKLPYKGEAERKYLISPFTREDYERVKVHHRKGKKLDFDIFRELVWGKKGEEKPNYCMMIDWVYEHQCQQGCYSKKEIKQEYENFLKKIYQKCVCDKTK